MSLCATIIETCINAVHIQTVRYKWKLVLTVPHSHISCSLRHLVGHDGPDHQNLSLNGTSCQFRFSLILKSSLYAKVYSSNSTNKHPDSRMVSTGTEDSTGR